MTIKDTQGNRYEIEAEIGTGGQAKAHRAKRCTDGSQVIIKLFHQKHSGAMHRAAIERLTTVIAHGREISMQLPEVLIAFPTHIIDDGNSFGVVMPPAVGKEMIHDEWFIPPDNQTKEFTGKAIYGIQQGVFPYRNLILAGFHLARAIDLLHRKGMAHSDLSLMNVFIEPETGRVSIIDCDNLACDGYLEHQVRGTPGFIAPELLPGKNGSTVNTKTDRFSLGVLIFYLLMLRHPLVGNQGEDWSPTYRDVEDSFGSRAVFTEHPTNVSNRYGGSFPHVRFDSLPEELRKMFGDVFVHGLNDPEKRPTARRWAQSLWSAYEDTLECSECTQRFFLSPSAGSCPFCRGRLNGPHYRLKAANGRSLLAEHGRKIFPHHAKTAKDFDFSEELCEFQLRPMEDGSKRMILRNLSAPRMSLVVKGTSRACAPAQGFVLSGVEKVVIGDITYIVESF